MIKALTVSYAMVLNIILVAVTNRWVLEDLVTQTADVRVLQHLFQATFRYTSL